MSTVNNIHKYKKAIQVKKDLTECALLMDKFMKDIAPYLKYNIIADTFRTTRDNYMWANIYINDQKEIIENKGSE